MRLITALISILFFCLQPVFASDLNSKIEDAKQAYAKKNFEKSITIYQNAIEDEKENPSLYFNLGLSYRADKQYAKAIWAFEKTLKLKPNDSEAIELIDACYLELDASSTWKSEEGNFMRSLYALGSNFWAWTTIVFSMLTALFIIRFRQKKSIAKKKMQLSLAVSSGVLLLFCLFVAYSNHKFERTHDYAIVVEKEIPVFEEASLSNNDTSALQLTPGAKVKILKWNKTGRKAIQTQDGKEGFVESGIARI